MKITDRVVEMIRGAGGIFYPFGGRKTQIQSGYGKYVKSRGRIHNPIAANMADIVNWILYDRITYAASATIPQLFRLFVAPIGTGAKTKSDTNMEQVSRLPDPEWMNVTGLSITFNSNAAPLDVVNFLTTTYLEFWVGNKVYIEGPLDCFPASGGVLAGNVSNVTAGATIYALNSTNGWPSINNMYDLRLPAGLNLGNSPSDGLTGITILQGQTFNLQFKADGGGATLLANNGVTPYLGTGLVIGARLHGIKSRAVA
jgi:hypothetical protein